jgi:hypothetical protein
MCVSSVLLQKNGLEEISQAKHTQTNRFVIFGGLAVLVTFVTVDP